MIKTEIPCYGCGVCAAECKFSAITMILSPDGFFVPHINTKKCIDCGQCDKICSFLDNTVLEQKNKISEIACSAVTKDDEILLNTTSGGLAFELAKICLENNYSVIGCKYDYDKQIAAHIVCDSEEELKQTMGSKYIQSSVSDVLKNIDINKKYAMFGSPCQIDSIRRFVRKNHCEQNWIFIDFFCHGVPSYSLWRKYTNYHTPKNMKIVSVKFRDKKNGWGVYTMTMTMTMTNGICYSRALNQNDFFLNIFLGNYVLNKPCYSCKFHGLRSSADITIGDFWGKKYESNKTGVSLAVVLTETGSDLLRRATNYCSIGKETIDDALEGQITENISIPKNREKILNKLKTETPLPLIYFRYCIKQWRAYFFPKFVRKTLRLILRRKKEVK